MCALSRSFVSNYPHGLWEPPASSVHGIFQARILEWAVLLQGIFLTQVLNPCFLCLLRWQADSLPLCYLSVPGDTVVSMPEKAVGQKQGLACKSRRTSCICRPIKGSRLYGLHLQPLSRPGLPLRTPCLPPLRFDLSRLIQDHSSFHPSFGLTPLMLARWSFLWASGHQTKSLVIGLDKYLVYPVMCNVSYAPKQDICFSVYSP